MVRSFALLLQLASILQQPHRAAALQAPRVLDVDGLAKAGIARLRERGAVVTEGLGAASLAEAIVAHEAVIVRSASTLTKDLLSSGAAASLRCVGRAGVGVDNIDTAAAAALGLPVEGAHARRHAPEAVEVVLAPRASCALICQSRLERLYLPYLAN